MGLPKTTTAPVSSMEIAHAPISSEWLQKLKDIPTLPWVAMKVGEMMNDPHSTQSQIAQILKTDQVLTAKVLKLANSSYYSIPGGVTDVSKALGFLGFNTVAQLVLTVSVFSIFTRLEGADFSLTEFWRHALAVATAAEFLAKKTGFQRPDTVFTGGLLHDIGKLALLQVDPKTFAAIIKRSHEKQSTFVESERELGAPAHAHLGAALAARWSLPTSICSMIDSHHLGEIHMEQVLEESRAGVRLIRLANSFVVKSKIGKSGNASDGQLLESYFTSLGLMPSVAQELEKHLQKEMDRMGVFLSASR